MEDKDNRVHLWEPSAFAQSLRDDPPKPMPITDPARKAIYDKLNATIKKRGEKMRLLQELQEQKGK